MMRSKNYFCESRWIGNESLPHKSTLVSNISCCLDTEKKVNILEIIFPCWPFGRRTETNFIRPETEFGKNIFVWSDRHHPLGHTPLYHPFTSHYDLSHQHTQLIKKIRGQKVFLCKQTSLQTWNKTFSVLLYSFSQASATSLSGWTSFEKRTFSMVEVGNLHSLWNDLSTYFINKTDR